MAIRESILEFYRSPGKMTSPGMTAWEGESQAMSQSPGLTWLNNSKFKVMGTADLAKGEAHGQFADSK